MTYPTEISPTVKHYPIEQIGASWAFDRAAMYAAHGSFVWQVQKAIADARFDMLNLMLEKDMVPVADRDRIIVRVELSRECVSREASPDGRPIALPDNLHTAVTAMAWGWRS